jgi:wobble nucleotide-excising tRNase
MKTPLYETVLKYLSRVRQVGHTTAILRAAETATRPTVVLTHTLMFARWMKEQIRNTNVRVFSKNTADWDKGINSVLLLDNATIHDLCLEASNDVAYLTEANIDLRGKYEAVVKTLERIKSEADGVKRHADYLESERQRLIRELEEAKSNAKGYDVLLKERDDILNHKWQLEDKLRAVRTALDS